MRELRLESYLAQVEIWPPAGRQVLAQFDQDAIVVYQAFKPAIATFADRHGYFGDGFKQDRMSWIKPGFLWMMYRSGWATKENQGAILAVWFRRSAFDEILSHAVPSTFWPDWYLNDAEWQAALKASDVRLQWDPDHDPYGAKLERRAVQLGLRGSFLERYVREWILDVQDITPLVREQHQHVQSGDLQQLSMPREDIYPAGGLWWGPTGGRHG